MGAGKVRERDEFLKLAPQNSAGVPVPNGPHTIVLVSDKLGKDSMGNDRLEVTVKEQGVTKLWTIPLKDKEGNLHYLVQALSVYPEGETLVVEMKKKGPKNYVDVRKVGELKAGDEIPTVHLDENGEEDDGIGEGGQDGESGDIPF